MPHPIAMEEEAGAASWFRRTPLSPPPPEPVVGGAGGAPLQQTAVAHRTNPRRPAAKPAFLRGAAGPPRRPQPAAARCYLGPAALIPALAFFPGPLEIGRSALDYGRYRGPLCAVGPKSPNSVIKEALAGVRCRERHRHERKQSGSPDGLAAGPGGGGVRAAGKRGGGAPPPRQVPAAFAIPERRPGPSAASTLPGGRRAVLAVSPLAARWHVRDLTSKLALGLAGPAWRPSLCLSEASGFSALKSRPLAPGAPPRPPPPPSLEAPPPPSTPSLALTSFDQSWKQLGLLFSPGDRSEGGQEPLGPWRGLGRGRGRWGEQGRLLCGGHTEPQDPA
ncbi:unnamed protein product [Rangifer tarandus platyrhynchus]|uniref:Uncharacterized protein n=1 Tax=Rangifer tarandus platyrhynchus TaxID=3082113 RepID=A0AC59YHX6_RANTA